MLSSSLSVAPPVLSPLPVVSSSAPSTGLGPVRESVVLPPVPKPARYIGLDIHKHYLIAAGGDGDKQQVLPFQRVEWKNFGAWKRRTLNRNDAVVIEMTTNSCKVYDALVEHVQSVTVVHPPHVALITRARVMNDKRASLILANLHAAGLLAGIWVPSPTVRDLRLLIAERWKLVKMATVVKTRLHNVLHRHYLEPPKGSQPFHPKHEEFWLGLTLSAAEKAAVRCDWATLQFANGQRTILDKSIAELSVHEPRVPLLLQIPGMGTLLA